MTFGSPLVRSIIRIQNLGYFDMVKIYLIIFGISFREDFRGMSVLYPQKRETNLIFKEILQKEFSCGYKSGRYSNYNNIR